jgi:hypothetical protein
MQNEKQASKFFFLNYSALAFLTMAFLFSCSKDNVDNLSQDNALNLAGQNEHASSRTSIVAVPFETTEFVRCANGGAGEDVQLNGYTAFVYQIVWNDHDFSLSYHGNNHQVTGVGLSSGDSFAGSGGYEGTAMGSWVNNQWVGNTIQHLRIVGPNAVFTVNFKLQLIVTPDGSVSVSTLERTVDCN